MILAARKSGTKFGLQPFQNQNFCSVCVGCNLRAKDVEFQRYEQVIFDSFNLNSLMRTQFLFKCIGSFTAILLFTLAWAGLAYCGEIHDAVRAGDLEKIKALLRSHPRLVFSKDHQGATPLLRAAEFDHLEVAAFLVANKAEVNARAKDIDYFDDHGRAAGMDQGGTPLCWGAAAGDEDMVELLLTNKADINMKDGQGETPLQWAVEMNREEMTHLLLAKGAHVNAASKEGTTALHWATQNCRSNLVELLLSKGADVDAKDKDGETPLHVAAQFQGLSARFPGCNGIVELLLAHGADVNARNKDGDTPLHTAATFCFGDISMAELLVVHGANVNARNKKGYTPLSIPKDYSVPPLAELLKKHGGKD
jgi:ankyrin repeat protein